MNIAVKNLNEVVFMVCANVNKLKIKKFKTDEKCVWNCPTSILTYHQTIFILRWPKLFEEHLITFHIKKRDFLIKLLCNN